LAVQLGALKPGQAGVIASVSTSESCAKRLADFGFVCGARLEMVCAGDPCIVRIDQTSVGLGGVHQQKIDLILH
jgi:Fe2+ transport system protein FeoA